MERVFDDHAARVMLPRHWTRFGAAYRAAKINGFGVKTIEARVHRFGWFDYRAVPYIDSKLLATDV